MVRVATAAHRFATESQAGASPEETLGALKAEIDATRDVFLGKNSAFDVLRWHRDGSLAKYLIERYGIDGEEDPVGACLARFALSVVKLHRQWTSDALDDAQTQAQLVSLKSDTTRDLLGLKKEPTD